MKKVLFLFFITGFLYGQESGSPYTKFGLGFFNNFVSARATGKAGTSIASFDENELSIINPAAASKIQNTIFSSGLILETSSSKDNNASKSFNNINFNNSLLGIPIYKEREMVLSFGFLAKSKIGYNIEKEIISNSVLAKETFFGTGGLSEFLLGLSYSPIPKLNLGLNFEYNFGEIQHSGGLKFNYSEYTDNEYTNSMYLRGISFTAGAIYSLGQIFDLHSVNVGFYFSPKSNLNVKKERTSFFRTSSGTFTDTLFSPDYTISLPMNYGIGLEIGLTEKLILAFDYSFMNWQDYMVDGLNEDLKNSNRFSLSCEYLPEKDVLADYTNRLRLSAGLYYEQKNIELDNNRINEFGVTLGCGIPFSKNSVLNSALVYGNRGTVDNGLIKDSFIKLQLSLTLSELWFVRTEDQ
jgi:long-subunit fatty acid transport protein